MKQITEGFILAVMGQRAKRGISRTDADNIAFAATPAYTRKNHETLARTAQAIMDTMAKDGKITVDKEGWFYLPNKV